MAGKTSALCLKGVVNEDSSKSLSPSASATEPSRPEVSRASSSGWLDWSVFLLIFLLDLSRLKI